MNPAQQQNIEHFTKWIWGANERGVPTTHPTLSTLQCCSDELHLMLHITDMITRNLILGVVAEDAQHSNDIEDVQEEQWSQNLLKQFEAVGSP